MICRGAFLYPGEGIVRILIKILCLAAALSLMLCGCGGRERSAYSVFCDFSQRYTLPSGVFYTSEAQGESILSKELFTDMFKTDDGRVEWDDFESCTLWLGSSFVQVYEMGIFFCADRSDAEEIYDMCKRRCERVSDMHAYPDTSLAQDAVVTISGKVVYYLILPDSKAAQHAMERSLGRW